MKKDKFLTILTDAFSKFDKALVLGPNDETVEDILNAIIVESQPTLFKEEQDLISFRVNLMTLTLTHMNFVSNHIPDKFCYKHGEWFGYGNRWFIFIADTDDSDEEYWCEILVSSNTTEGRNIIGNNTKQVYEKCIDKLLQHENLRDGYHQLQVVNDFK